MKQLELDIPDARRSIPTKPNFPNPQRWLLNDDNLDGDDVAAPNSEEVICQRCSNQS